MKEKSKKFIKLCEKIGVNPDVIPEIMSVDEAFKSRKMDIKKLPGVAMLPKRFRRWLVDTFKIAVVTEALNTMEDGKVWLPDYSNPNEPKYEIWWEVKADKKHPSGSGLSFSDYGNWATLSFVPARLCFRNSDIGKYAAHVFPDVYKYVQLIIEK